MSLGELSRNCWGSRARHRGLANGGQGVWVEVEGVLGSTLVFFLEATRPEVGSLGGAWKANSVFDLDELF